MKDELQEHINKETKVDINQLYKHAEIANSEMSVIKNDIEWIKGILVSFEKKLEGFDIKLWGILGSTIIAIVLQILLRVVWK